MPAGYQGTVFRSQGDPILNLKNVQGMGLEEQRLLIDAALQQLTEVLHLLGANGG